MFNSHSARRLWAFLFKIRKEVSVKKPVIIYCEHFSSNQDIEVFSLNSGKIYLFSKWIPGLLSNRLIFFKIFKKNFYPSLFVAFGKSAHIDAILREAQNRKITTISINSRSDFKLGVKSDHFDSVSLAELVSIFENTLK
jgi:hypothetical protein